MQERNFCLNQILEFLKKRNSLWVEGTVNKRGAGRRRNYLYINSPDGTLNV